MRDTSTIKVEPKPVSKGHSSHRSGAGQHKDRRTKRNRTRQAQRDNSIRDW